jgi:hypothetical protein
LQIDNNLFHCITCNDVYSINEMKTHFENLHHKRLVDESSEAYKTFKNEQLKVADAQNDLANCSATVVGNIERSEAEKDDDIKILSFIEKFDKNDIKINMDNKTAFCRKCCEGVDFSHTNILNHIEHHYLSKDSSPPNTNELKDNKKLQLDSSVALVQNDIKTSCNNEKKKTEENSATNENPEDYAKLNNLTYNMDKKDAYCRSCQVRLPATLKSMKEHINGLPHKKTLSQSSSKANVSNSKEIRKIPFQYFATDVVTFQSLFVTEEIVNEKFCVEKFSLYLIVRTGRGFRCQLCEENLAQDEVFEHMNSSEHLRAIALVPVIISLDSELVREVILFINPFSARKFDYFFPVCHLTLTSYEIGRTWYSKVKIFGFIMCNFFANVHFSKINLNCSAEKGLLYKN